MDKSTLNKSTLISSFNFDIRSMFSSIFGKQKKPSKEVTKLQLLNNWNNYFNNFSGDVYNNPTIRATIDAVARFTAKLQITHVRQQNGRAIKINDTLNSILSTRPNPYMSTYDFLYKLTTLLYLYNNVFIYVQYAGSQVVGLYILDFNTVELKEDSSGEIYCKFIFNGKNITVPYSQIIHIRRHFAKHEIFGANAVEALTPGLNNLVMLQQSLESAIKNSSKLQGYLKIVGTLTPKDQQRALDDFTNSINGAGFGVVDSKTDFQQLTSDFKYADNDAITAAKQELYHYFGVSEKIVSGEFTEADYISFYESVIEPIAIQLSQEFTAKLFTEREKGHGNSIRFASSKLEYASLKDKVSLAQTLQQSGIIKINELREIFGLEPLEAGDALIQKADYSVLTNSLNKDTDTNEVGDTNNV